MFRVDQPNTRCGWNWPGNYTEWITESEKDEWFSNVSATQHWCCGRAVGNEGCPDDLIYTKVYNYDNDCIGMVNDPWYFDISSDIDDDNLQIIYKSDGLSSGGDYPHKEVVVSKDIGRGKLVLFGDAVPIDNQGFGYGSTSNLLGNMISLTSTCYD